MGGGTNEAESAARPWHWTCSHPERGEAAKTWVERYFPSLRQVQILVGTVGPTGNPWKAPFQKKGTWKCQHSWLAALGTQIQTKGSLRASPWPCHRWTPGDREDDQQDNRGLLLARTEKRCSTTLQEVWPMRSPEAFSWQEESSATTVPCW